MGKKRTSFRAWFYLRMGYSIYWAFFFMGINTLTVTYYLAIERAPFLKAIFPSFIHYAIFLIVVGVPILIFSGYSHYKKFPGFKSEAEINIESNPYQYKLPPGFWFHVIMPYFRLQSDILIKILNNEKLTTEEKTKLEDLQKKMDLLCKGGYVGDPERLKSLKSHEG